MTAIRGSNVYDGEIDWLATDRLRHGRRAEDLFLAPHPERPRGGAAWHAWQNLQVLEEQLQDTRVARRMEQSDQFKGDTGGR